MIHTLIKLKIFKLALAGAFSAGVIATLVAKEAQKKKKIPSEEKKTKSQ